MNYASTAFARAFWMKYCFELWSNKDMADAEHDMWRHNREFQLTRLETRTKEFTRRVKKLMSGYEIEFHKYEIVLNKLNADKDSCKNDAYKHGQIKWNLNQYVHKFKQTKTKTFLRACETELQWIQKCITMLQKCRDRLGASHPSLKEVYDSDSKLRALRSDLNKNIHWVYIFAGEGPPPREEISKVLEPAWELHNQL